MIRTTIFRFALPAMALGFVAAGASAQVLTPGGLIQGASTNGTTVASGAVGPLGQIRSGRFGQFAAADNWAALGESPFGVGSVLPYGLRLQKNIQFALFNQVTNTANGAEDLIVGWGENAGSLLRMRFISNQFNNTFTDVLKLQGGSLAPAAEITATAVAGAETPLRIGIADAPGSFLTIANATGGAGQFLPSIVGTRTGDLRESLFFGGVIDPGNDVRFPNNDPNGEYRSLVNVQGRLSNGTPVANRPIFAVSNLTDPLLKVFPSNFQVFTNVSTTGSFTGNAFITSSDQRFKEQITSIQNGLELVRKLRGTTYSFKQSDEFKKRNFPDSKQFGFIAQEIQKVMPEAVVQQADGYYGVNYIEVIPVLVEAVKQLDAKQTETLQLQQQLEAMKTQIADLRALVEKAAGPGAESKAGAPNPDLSAVQLEQNAPNPFSEVTRIAYTLPQNAAGAVLTISDMQGRQVKTMTNLAGGRQVIEIQAGSLAAGTYLYTLTVKGQEVISRRMVLTR